MSTLYLCTLGSFSLQVGDRKLPSLATQKARALLAYLVLHRGADIGRERLMEVLWPEADPERARNSLNTALWSIRRSLRDAGLDPDEYLVANRSLIRWVADTTSDIARFHALATQTESGARQEALTLYAGEFLEGDYEEWTVAEREKAAREYESLLSSVVVESGDAEAAQLLIARNPYDEGAYAALIEAELAAGRLVAAAALVERCRAALLEVGTAPTATFESRFGELALPKVQAPREFRLPFAGRGDELGVLQSYLQEAHNGNGRVVLVHGEAGIGKSALLSRSAELAREAGVRVVTVKAIEGDPRTFGPWHDLFEALTGKDFDATVTQSGDGAASVAESLSRAIAPTSMILVDDAHALQGEALRIFIAFTARAVRNSSHLVLVGLRPEGLRSMRTFFRDLPIGELHILGLSRSELEEALQRGACEAPREFADVLYVRTGGHPLFIVSLLNAMAGAGTLRFADRGWKVVQASAAYAELPESLRRHIEMRLSARGQTALSVACTFALDTAATADDLVEVTKLGETKLFDALDDLLALGLLVQPSSGPQFAFSHEMVRDVAASLLHAGRRTRLHRAFASRFTQRAEPDSSLRCARHLVAAGDHFAASEAYLQAAREALNWNALHEASERCAIGITELESLERSDDADTLFARLKKLATEIRVINATPDATIAGVTEALGLARQTGDDQALLDALLAREKALLHAYRVDEALEAARESEKFARQRGDEGALAVALADASWALRLSGRGRQAIEAANKAVKHANQTEQWAVVASATEQLIRCGITWWQFSQATAAVTGGMEAARRANLVATASFHICRAELYFVLERYADATEELRSALSIIDQPVKAPRSTELVQRIELSWLRISSRALDCVLGIARKNWNEAIAATEELARQGAFETGSPLRERAAILQLDSLLGRGTADDVRLARELSHFLQARSMNQDVFTWSRCAVLSEARTAALLGESEAKDLLLQALDALEDYARVTPLDADRAFAELAQSAREFGSEVVSKRATLRCQYYRSRRIAAAGPNWGGASS